MKLEISNLLLAVNPEIDQTASTARLGKHVALTSGDAWKSWTGGVIGPAMQATHQCCGKRVELQEESPRSGRHWTRNRTHPLTVSAPPAKEYMARPARRRADFYSDAACVYVIRRPVPTPLKATKRTAG